MWKHGVFSEFVHFEQIHISHSLITAELFLLWGEIGRRSPCLAEH